ncbi:MAG: hypothetical protein AAGA56_26470 [Myxococcota bacterium]
MSGSKRMRQILPIAGAALLTGLGFMGCGDDEEETVTPTTLDETGSAGGPTSTGNGVTRAASPIELTPELCDASTDVEAVLAALEGTVPSQAALDAFTADPETTAALVHRTAAVTDAYGVRLATTDNGFVEP